MNTRGHFTRNLFLFYSFLLLVVAFIAVSAVRNDQWFAYKISQPLMEVEQVLPLPLNR